MRYYEHSDGGKNQLASANPLGRFPANFIHDGSDEVTALFLNNASRFFYTAKASPSERNEGLEEFEAKEVERDFGTNNIAIKRSERQVAKMQNFHPTVKPLALMQYLIRLITPPDGVVLDCFAGSGTTGVAAVKERKKYVLIEREEEYIKIIEARVKHAESKIDPTLFDEVV